MVNKLLQFRGIIIRTLISSEADLIVAILAEDGEKYVTLAKQARKSRKRFANSLDLFDFGRFEASSGKGGLPLLQSFIPEHGFRLLRESLSKLSCASVLAESVDLLVPEAHGDNSHGAVFELLLSGLTQINDAKETKQDLRFLYMSLISLLHTSGYHDPSQELKPSLHALRSVINQIERSAEKKLKSKEALELIASSIKS
jgi:DNA repair protein RecO (recombination protein O)